MKLTANAMDTRVAVFLVIMTLVAAIAVGVNMVWAESSPMAAWLATSRVGLHGEEVDGTFGKAVSSTGNVECVTIPIGVDASVSSRQPGVNFGNEQTLKVGRTAGQSVATATRNPDLPTPTPVPESETWRTYLQLDPSKSYCPPMCGGSSTISATLSIYMLDSTGRAKDAEACPVASQWFEHGVTWNNTPRVDETACEPWAMGASAGRYALDVKDTVAEWVDQTRENHGWVLRSRDPRDEWLRIFASREWRQEDQRPLLEVCYETEAGPRPTIRPPILWPTYPDAPAYDDLPIESPLNPPTGCGPTQMHPPLINLTGGAGGCSPCCGGATRAAALTDTGIAWGSGAGVYLHSGESYLSEVDLEIPGRGFDYRLERKYRSGIRYAGLLGASWSSSYERRLIVEQVPLTGPGSQPDGAGNVTLADGFGRVDGYVRAPDGSYKAPGGYFTTLTRQDDGTFIERDSQGLTVTYAAPDEGGVAPMTSLTDRHGNTMRFEHDGEGRVSRVLDTLGRPIDYEYDSEGRIAAVEDFVGRRVTYTYDAAGDLVAVTSPAVAGTPNGNDFPEGRTWRYGYSSGSSDPRLNHNLQSITAPNEVAVGGAPKLRLTYDGEDRVTAMSIGGVNASGVPAGGTIQYTYSQLQVPGRPGVNAAVRQTEVIDRNGNRTLYQMNRLGNIVAKIEAPNRDIRPGDAAEFVTRYEYGAEGHLLREVKPEGNRVETTHDLANADRLQQGNLLAQTVHADAGRGGDQARLTSSYTYEPVYNKIRTSTDPRGHDADYRPPIALPGEQYPNPERYTTVYTYDYQEGEDYEALGGTRQVSASDMRTLLLVAGVPMGLGDVNGDGRTDGVTGNVVRIQHPAVNLSPSSNMAGIEGDTRQERTELFAYNRHGQMTWQEDAEGNATVYAYYPENDPDGDGRDLTPGMGTGEYGYVRSVTIDAGAAPPSAAHVVYLPFTSTRVEAGLLRAAQDSRDWLRATTAAPASVVMDAARHSGAGGPYANITTRFAYDRVGNVIQELDPRGVATVYTVNALNEVVQVIRAADVSGALANPEEPNWAACGDVSLPECRAGMVPFGYRTLIHYDANGNVVRLQIENRDTANDALLGAFVESESHYDMLDQLIEVRHEVSESPAAEVVARYRYDANGNQVLVTSPVTNLPAGHPEAQPSNVTSTVYDERDLVYSQTRGGLTEQFVAIEAHAGIAERATIPNGVDLATTTRGYDANGNLVAITDAGDNTGDGQPETSLGLYDGFDRPVSVVDALGNQSFSQYDPAGNVVARSRYGPTGGPSPVDNAAATLSQPLERSSFTQPLLSRFESGFDEARRLSVRNDSLFTYDDVAYQRQPVLVDGPDDTPGDGWVTTRYEYDRKGRPLFTVEDDGDTTRAEFDGADRLVRAVDAENNEALTQYNDAGNATRITQVERSRAAEVAAGTVPALEHRYTRVVVYDALGRAVRSSDNVGQSTRTSYDSRDNVVAATDAQYSQNATDLIADPLGVVAAGTRINRPGNRTTTERDGLDRMVRQVGELRQGGQGSRPIDTSNSSNPDGLVILATVWDGNSRVVARTDDTGQTTRYAYDDLGRGVQRTLADGTVYTSGYDLDGHLRQFSDPNGSVSTLSVDGLGRNTAVSIAPGAGIVGTTHQIRQFDGLSRMRSALDENDADNNFDDVGVAVAYDSLGRTLEEQVGNLAVSSRWSGDGRRLALVYPDGRTLQYTHDGVDHVDTIAERPGGGGSAVLADYDRMGSGRLLERRLANGTVWTQLSDDRTAADGYDELGRLVRLRHMTADGELVAGFDYGYSRANRPRYEDKLHDAVNGEMYPYDSLGRLVDYRRGRLNADGSGVSEPSPNAMQRQTWQLDGAGDWSETSRTVAGSEQSESRDHSAIHAVEQVGDTTLSYDANGNLTDDGTQLYRWDGLGRLREVVRKSDGAEVAIYAYDALNRRAAKIVRNSGALDGTYRFYQDGERVIEERDASGRLRRQHVFGAWLDEPVAMDTDLDGDGVVTGAADRRVYHHQNGQFSVFALTDADGKVVEGYQYDPFGRPNVYTPGANGELDWGGDDVISAAGASAYGNPYLYTGRRYEPEIGMYYYRARYMDPQLGRFISQDPLGAWGTANLGNAYAYVADAPQTAVDPSGLRRYEVGKTYIYMVNPPQTAVGPSGMGPGDPTNGIDTGNYVYPPGGSVQVQSAGSGAGGGAVAMGPGDPIDHIDDEIDALGGIEEPIDALGHDRHHPQSADGAIIVIGGRRNRQSIKAGGPEPIYPCPPIGPLPPGVSIDEEGLSSKMVAPGSRPKPLQPGISIDQEGISSKMVGPGSGGGVLPLQKMVCTGNSTVMFCESDTHLCVCLNNDDTSGWECGCVAKGASTY